MENVSTYDKVKAIRNDTTEPDSDINFKKVAFGGYECKEVAEYIRTLKNKILLSERAFNEKIEEYSSASNMFLHGRDKLNQKIKEQEDEIEKIKNDNLTLIEGEKETLEPYLKENEKLKSLVQDLQQQIVNGGLNEKIKKEIEDAAKSNKKLSDEVCKLTEIKNKLDSQNAVLNNRVKPGRETE